MSHTSDLMENLKLLQSARESRISRGVEHDDIDGYILTVQQQLANAYNEHEAANLDEALATTAEPEEWSVPKLLGIFAVLIAFFTLALHFILRIGGAQ